MYYIAIKVTSLFLSGIIYLGALYIWFPDIMHSTVSDQVQLGGYIKPANSPNNELDYSELNNRPIFQKSRRFKFVEAENAQQDKPFIPEIPLVKGLAITEPNDKFVFIQSSKDGIVYQLREGQLLDGLWRVLDINFSEILLLDENGNEISLDVDT